MNAFCSHFLKLWGFPSWTSSFWNLPELEILHCVFPYSNPVGHSSFFPIVFLRNLSSLQIDNLMEYEYLYFASRLSMTKHHDNYVIIDFSIVWIFFGNYHENFVLIINKRNLNKFSWSPPQYRLRYQADRPYLFQK